MNNDEWNKICSTVTDRMLQHVRNFVCPLSSETETDVRLIGTGSFIEIQARTTILTCEHVAIEKPLNYRFLNEENVYGYRGEWHSEKEPVDASLTDDVLTPAPATDKTIKDHQIALSHQIVDKAELLFFCGFAGENSKFVLEHHFTNLTGFCTQQNGEAENDLSCFELLWPNGLQSWSSATPEEAKRNIEFSNPQGFSGSLIWNTRFVESGCNIDKWTPDQAKVTGILKRFDDKNGVLLATPIEAIRQAMRF